MDRGHNLRIELRWGAGDPDRIGTLARELVELRPDAVVGQTTPVTGALARETRTIPIVFAVVSDPIGSGFATSFAHPGGNITGFTTNEPAVGGKWMELLKEIAPGTARVGLLFNPTNPAAHQIRTCPESKNREIARPKRIRQTARGCRSGSRIKPIMFGCGNLRQFPGPLSHIREYASTPIAPFNQSMAPSANDFQLRQCMAPDRLPSRRQWSAIPKGRRAELTEKLPSRVTQGPAVLW
jgi:ABC transporter substrate binding protein